MERAQVAVADPGIREAERRLQRGEKDESQKNLQRWTDEEWRTQEGDARARGDDGETKRYLPKKAWEHMSEGEKRETEEKKCKGSREGQQYVPNTEGAKKARKASQALPVENYDDLSVEQIKDELDGLTDKELERISEYEKADGKRKTLMDALDREL